jgi:SAM-dependent methyltransferase
LGSSQAVNRATSSAQSVPRDAMRYHFVMPDYERHPDVYSRTWQLLEWVGTGKRVLELGCSTGFMTKYLTEKRACRVVAIEVDPEAAAQAGQWCGDVLVRSLDSADWATGLSPRAFDVVLLGDVLEHLVDPPRLLNELKPLLAADAKLVISLPNVVHWVTRLKLLFGRFDYEPGGTLDHTHLRFYTVPTARKLIENAGYRITRFHAAFGGRLTGHARPVWQALATHIPGLFAFQLLFEAKPNLGNA